jgi:hypothetical protein
MESTRKGIHPGFESMGSFEPIRREGAFESSPIILGGGKEGVSAFVGIEAGNGVPKKPGCRKDSR